MRKSQLIILVVLVCLLTVLNTDVFAKAKITFLTGTVKYQKSGSEDWVDAKKDLELEDNDSIKTGKFSNVELEFPEDNSVKIAQNTVLTVEQIGKDSKSSFKVESGKVFMQIKKGEDTDVKTPNAVAGVRGTKFFVEFKEGETFIFVVEGSVWVKRLGFEEEKVLNEGQLINVLNSGFGQLRTASSRERMNFGIGIPIMLGGSSSQDMLKNSLRTEMKFEKNNLNNDRNDLSGKKNEDFVTGRTLKDVHGVPVRVEQIFKRPGTASFQLINITKRDDGLTYLDWKMTYNKPLPEDINDWGSFFEDQGDNLHIELREVDMGTMKDGFGDNLRWLGRYNAETGELDETFFVNGIERDGSFSDYEDSRITDPDNFYSYGELPLYEAGTYGQPEVEPVEIIVIRTYIINDDGKIISVRDFASSGDVFSLISTSAGEIILSADSFVYGDIDLVMIGGVGVVFVMYML